MATMAVRGVDVLAPEVKEHTCAPMNTMAVTVLTEISREFEVMNLLIPRDSNILLRMDTAA